MSKIALSLVCIIAVFSACREVPIEVDTIESSSIVTTSSAFASGSEVIVDAPYTYSYYLKDNTAKVFYVRLLNAKGVKVQTTNKIEYLPNLQNEIYVPAVKNKPDTLSVYFDAQGEDEQNVTFEIVRKLR